MHEVIASEKKKLKKQNKIEEENTKLGEGWRWWR